MSISEARTKADVDDTEYSVRGKITATVSSFKDKYSSQNGNGFCIQDETGGILVYVEDMQFYDDHDKVADLVLGRWVMVTGPIDTNTGPLDDGEGGTHRIKPASFSNIIVGEMGNEVLPRQIHPDQVKDYQGELVQITDVNVSHLFVVSQWGRDYRVADTQGRSTSLWFYPYWIEQGQGAFPVVGQQYEYITGVAAVFIKNNMSHILEEEFEIWPRSNSDYVQKLEIPWSDWEQSFVYNAFLDELHQFKLFWSNLENDTIEFGMEVHSRGWIALGISPDGNMAGSDIFIGWMNEYDGMIHLQDRFAANKSSPILDNKQDLENISGEQVDGWTRIRFTRSKYLCDDEHDVAIQTGTTRLIFAWNDEYEPDDEYLRGMMYTLQKHTNKGQQSLNLNSGAYGASGVDISNSIENLKYIDFRMKDYLVPSDRDTTYYCLNFKLPKFENPENKAHGVKIEPMITAGNENLIQHVVLWRCPQILINESIHTSLEDHCYLNDAMPYCFGGGLVTGFAVGAKAFSMPHNVGHVLGGDEFKYGILQIHYDNRKYVPGIIDSSGIRVWYTEQLREYEIGLINIGLPVPYKHENWANHFIPPGMQHAVNYAYCPADCTTAGLPPDGVKIFTSLLHTKHSGTAMRLRHIRNGVELEPIATDWTYDYLYQQPTHYAADKEITLLAGDELILECYYNTTKRNHMTWGGLGTQNEVCLAYLAVYPKPELFGCYTAHTTQQIEEWYNVSLEKGYIVNNYEGDVEWVARGGEKEECAQMYYNELWTDPHFEHRYHICLATDNQLLYDIDLYQTITDFDVYQHPTKYYGCDEYYDGYQTSISDEKTATMTWDSHCNQQQEIKDEEKEKYVWKTVAIAFIISFGVLLAVFVFYIFYNKNKGEAIIKPNRIRSVDTDMEMYETEKATVHMIDATDR